MSRALDDYGSLAVCADPGKAIHAVAEKPAARGLGVRRPGPEESWCLTIANAERARCELTVEDGGSVRWDCLPAAVAPPLRQRWPGWCCGCWAPPGPGALSRA